MLHTTVTVPVTVCLCTAGSVYCAVGTELQASEASVRIHSVTALRHLCTGTAGYELGLCMGVQFGSVRKWSETRRVNSGSHSGTADNSSLFGCDAVCWPVVRRHGVAHQKTRTNGAKNWAQDGGSDGGKDKTAPSASRDIRMRRRWTECESRKADIQNPCRMGSLK